MIADFDPDVPDSERAGALRDRFPGKQDAERWIRDYTSSAEVPDDDEEIVWSDKEETGQCARTGVSPGR